MDQNISLFFYIYTLFIGHFANFNGLLHRTLCAITTKDLVWRMRDLFITEVSYQGSSKVNGWGDLDQNTLFVINCPTKPDKKFMMSLMGLYLG